MKSVKFELIVLTLLAVIALTTFQTQSNPSAATQNEKIVDISGLQIGDDNAGAWIQPVNGRGIRINANRNRYGIVIKDNGYVGIAGQTNPQFPLHVQGEVSASAFKTSDIIFRSGDKEAWKMYEKEDGLYLQNIDTGESSKIFLEKDLKPIQDELKELKKELNKLTKKKTR